MYLFKLIMKSSLQIIMILTLAGCAQPKVQKTTAENQTKPVTEISVLSYNIHHANPPSRPGVIDLEAIANVIRQQQPDLVALQEVDVFTSRSGASINQAAELGRLTGMYYYFAKAIDYGGGDYGVAILSKYPIENPQHYSLPTVEATGGEHRTLATVSIKLPDNKKLLFACTHLDAQRNDTNRVEQIKSIKQILQKEESPVIIAGDFNAVPGSRVIQLMDTFLQRGCISHCAFTIPEVKPTKEIDFIAYAPFTAFDVIEYKVINETYASDHRPVKAIVRLK